MNCVIRNTELSSLEETRSEFNRSKAIIKLGIDVHQDFLHGGDAGERE